MSVEAQIRHFILENFLFTSNEEKLKNTDSFLDKGIVDSTGILELLMFVEETFGVEVEDEEVLPENFGSVAQLARYIGRKNGVAAPSSGSVTAG